MFAESTCKYSLTLRKQARSFETSRTEVTFFPVAKSKTVDLSIEVSEKLYQWMDVAKQAKELKEREFALRQEIVMKAGFDPTKLEGTETLAIGGGWLLKANKKQNYSLTNKNNETLALLNVIGALRPDIATSLVEWQPDFKKKAYNELLKFIEGGDLPNPDDAAGIRSLLAAALTIKPGTPELELVPPEPPKEAVQ